MFSPTEIYSPSEKRHQAEVHARRVNWSRSSWLASVEDTIFEHEKLGVSAIEFSGDTRPPVTDDREAGSMTTIMQARKLFAPRGFELAETHEASTREAFIAALTAEAAFDGNVEDVAGDIDFEYDDVDRERVALSLWRMGAYANHLGECLVDYDANYVNECLPCQEHLLAIADRLLSRIVPQAG